MIFIKTFYWLVAFVDDWMKFCLIKLLLILRVLELQSLLKNANLFLLLRKYFLVAVLHQHFTK